MAESSVSRVPVPVPPSLIVDLSILLGTALVLAAGTGRGDGVQGGGTGYTAAGRGTFDHTGSQMNTLEQRAKSNVTNQSNGSDFVVIIA